MLSIKQLPNSERPYEKLEMYGEKTLSNSELLAIILKTGTKDQTAVGLAQNILAQKGKEDLRSLQEISLIDLQKIKGIGKVKAIQIKAVCELAKRMSRPIDLNIVIKEPKDAATFVMDELRYEKNEVVKIIILNTKNIVQKVVDITTGNISSAKLDVKQIFEETIKTGMSRFILVHNHPSGDATPSPLDMEVTKKIEEGAKLLDLQLLDHIIIGDGVFQSIFTKRKQKINETKGRSFLS